MHCSNAVTNYQRPWDASSSIPPRSRLQRIPIFLYHYVLFLGQAEVFYRLTSPPEVIASEAPSNDSELTLVNEPEPELPLAKEQVEERLSLWYRLPLILSGPLAFLCGWAFVASIVIFFIGLFNLISKDGGKVDIPHLILLFFFAEVMMPVCTISFALDRPRFAVRKAMRSGVLKLSEDDSLVCNPYWNVWTAMALPYVLCTWSLLLFLPTIITTNKHLTILTDRSAVVSWFKSSPGPASVTVIAFVAVVLVLGFALFHMCLKVKNVMERLDGEARGGPSYASRP